MILNISDISISGIMSRPKSAKIDDKIMYWLDHGRFPEPVYITDENILTDGYTSYLAAVELGVDQIECEYENISPKAQIVQMKRCNFSYQKRNQVYNNNNGICPICGKPVSKNNFTVDHWQPLAKGGTNAMNNLKPAHKRCNHHKGDMTIDEYCESLLDVVQYQARRDEQIAKIMIRSSVRLVMHLTARKVKAFLL